MKKALLIAAAILLFAGAVHADAYIGVFADAGHSVNNASPAAFTPFDVWIWVLPDAVLGVQAAEFGATFPATVITTNTVVNPLITVALGSLTAGTSVAYGACNTDWVYTHHLTCMSLAAGAPGRIDLVGDASVSPPIFAIATCEPGFPYGPVKYFTPLYLYQLGPISTQSASWGAIKNLF